MENDDIRQFSTDELRQLRRAGKTKTRSDALENELDEAFWQNTRIVFPSLAEKTPTKRKE